ncbi:Lysophospholipase L1 [Carnobacterium iners]|uniref:Lysophospholipase L1 n=1 Tax=Carnobacterium iners TaxID=1073423 RepID=A0A1X7NDQ1_9LACT|nr:GDSL-type esterase/lipase family protein [Carnobacterium iners]SEK37548.1 Lysophospholipase L1 [Carnobacterium iners]SMH35849.1 Lysophospholipase L1 [Carnobacterium iners]
MKFVRSFLLTCLIVTLVTFIVFQGLNVMTDKKETVTTKQSPATLETIHLLAIGDSLTKGVGDSTKNGGYVPLVATQLEETMGIASVITKNYGVTGERSDEILERIEQEKEIQKEIKKADIIILTAGGNDLIETFKKEKLKINQKSFVQPEKEYKKNLSTILKKIMKQNSKAQIYVFGLYNPFEAMFPEITEMKTILRTWNDDTKKVAEENNATYLSLSKIFNNSEQSSISNLTNPSDKTDKSALLYEEDLFHPNDKGYQMIADKLYRIIMDNKE